MRVRSQMLGGMILVLLSAATAIGDDSGSVRALFAGPPREYSSSPLWVWNDLLREEQVLATMRDLASQDVKQVFVHPRPGLMTPYLSEDWFRLWKAVLREAETLDMNVWIYDENSYPSGFAGGFVPKAMPESRGLGLALTEAPSVPAWNDSTLAVYRLDGEQIENVSDAVRSGAERRDGRYVLASRTEAGTSPWFGGTHYVDLLRPGVTQKFLEVTLGAYQREVGEEFGKRIPGSFTDEPHLAPAGGLHWTPDLPEAFATRRGYSLMDNLPALSFPVGDFKRVRHDYYRTLLELFIERWAQPYYEYCARHGLEFTGHYWEHEWPVSRIAPDNMAMYAWHQRPAIDTLFNQYDEGPHAQFGNTRAVLELGSVANQLGLKRTLCEAYGGGGWDLRFEDMKRIGDWLFVLGVNTLDEHLSYITMRGARKYDYPQSFSYHEPWWDSYHVLARYFSRLSAALSHGEAVPEVLLIEPTTTAWMYQAPEDRPHLDELGASFQKLVVDLAKAQVEFDLGSEDVIARHGSVDQGLFRVGKRGYKTVLLPREMENINTPTLALLESFVREGGRLLCVGNPALERVDGQESGRGAELVKQPSVFRVETGQLAGQLLESQEDGFSIELANPPASSIVYHMRRRLSDGELLFLVNTRNDASAAGRISTRALGIEKWDLETGGVGPYFFDTGTDGVTADFHLPPCGSLLLFLSRKELSRAVAEAVPDRNIAPAGAMEIRPIGPNVLTLDYLDLTIGDTTHSSLYMYEAARRAFQSVGLPENPWDHAVQFDDELINKQLPPNNGFTAAYHFSIEGAAPESILAVVERPDLYTITCNGEAVAAAAGEWWLDRAFGRIDLSKSVKSGENTLTLTASAMTMFHEIAAVYILGDFALQPHTRGHRIVPSKPLEVGPWKDQGYPFYAEGVAYKRHYSIAKKEGRYVVRLPNWYGSIAKVLVNGTLAGHIGWQPAECDVTSQIREGDNHVEVIVIGTLKNTLGPHHGNPPLGIASPGSFRKGPESGPPPGAEYSIVGYGLMEPFELRGI